ncbi:hypothetical protein H7U19_08490 [Hyunsoonleella sp. SJ7]|uniref:Lipoprotein n=1 Tax=Hyunsoonleella aquatilis TaxID=2762758 RepID=A0A923KL27_9FLAO|nr:hypothetical protein [Hyunsoonleella aquatilis]MBC3758438.1 hypothetical protein [Hyunsoonleella aquatilis]
MKKFLILGFLLVFLSSCDLADDDGNLNFNFEVLPIESVDIPDSFELGAIYPITVSYLRPSTCHQFRDFYYLKENNERTVAVINYCFERNDCEELTDEVVEASFNFKVTSNGSYIFKFWQGEDENEVDQYLIVEVPVED